ncbi:formin-like protein 3 [Anopheles stephensi]|uniref:formin-like protein 3 n=1 Tax=Anopheles stephensi TaxID=30069 RepID=UPI0007D468B5|nr:formin-like protein 3 [Anopheles stephensi]
MLPNMRKLSCSMPVHLALLLLVGSAKCEPQEGYFYPRPTPQCVPQVFTETVTDYATETLNHFFTDVNTVYLTDYLTSTVVNPVLITSTEYAVSTVFVPQLEYVTETSTLVLQPSPVVQYVTETVLSTVFAQGDFSGGAAVNTYLPPEPVPLPVPVPNPVIINNGLQVQHPPPPPPPPYIPPPQVSLPPVLEHPVTHQPFLALDENFQGHRFLGAPTGGADAFGGVHSLPNVHAVPPTYNDHEGYRYKRKLAEETTQKLTTTTVSSKSA